MRTWVVVFSVLMFHSLALAEDADEGQVTVIRVTTEPVGAEVEIDGQSRGASPVTVGVEPGRHEVSVRVGTQRMRTRVDAREGEVNEVFLELASREVAEIASPFEEQEQEPPPPPPPSLPPPPQPQEEREVSGDTPDPRPEQLDGPWARRVYEWPLIEVAFVTSPMNRSFVVPIDEVIDTSGRNEARFESSWFGVMGFRVSVFPLFTVRPRPMRGLGFEFSYLFDIDFTVYNRRRNEEVDAEYSEGEILAVYRLVLGRPDLGAMVTTRIGWHRSHFFLGDVGNDIVPPFKYDTIRLDGGIRVPLGTRHVLFDLGLAYLAVLSVGGSAEQAYGAEGTIPTSHGGEVRLGLMGRIGGLEVAWQWVLRMFTSEFEGTGFGWGDDPTTRIDTASGRGIRTMGSVDDRFHQVRLSISYRW